MIATSSKWKDWSAQYGIFHIKATINNGTSMQLTDEDFMLGSVSITDSVSGMSEFNVGAVITNTFNATLNNFDGKFNNYNLGGATISVKFGIIFDDNTEEWIDRGTYTLEKPTSLGSTIKVVGYDDMDKMNKYYIGKYYDANHNLVDFSFPLAAYRFAQLLCEYCGVTFDVSNSWLLPSANVGDFEYNESTTCRQVLSWLCQSFGGYARIDNVGKIECKPFNRHEWSSADSMDGGTINPWSAVSSYDGGTINPWSAVTDYDGGTTGGAEFTLSKIKSLDVYIEDIVITGVRAYNYNTVSEFEFATYGTDGYIINITDNPFITGANNNASIVAQRVGELLNGLSLRPFNASIFGDPCIEAGDAVALQDYLGVERVSLITSLTYNLNQAERLECNAVTPEEADMQTANPQTSVIAGAVQATYDYIKAQKISADYIDAGTISASVKMDVDTADSSYDIIKLNYSNSSGTRTSTTSIESAMTTFDYTLNGATSSYALRWGNSAYIFLQLSNDQNSNVSYMDSAGYAGFSVEVRSASFVNTSLEEKKRDIEKIDSTLDKIKSADIISFNFNGEDKDAKKHIGLAIGENYNTPIEIIAEDKDGNATGVDLYAMVSMAWKAIQEQSEKIEQLEKRVAELESQKESK